MATIAAFLRVDERGEGSAYPQVGSDSSDPRLQAVYWRTAAVFYASSRRANPDVRHVLLTNVEPPTVDGHDLKAFFQELDVEILDTPFIFQPPEGYYESWGAQFYIIDMIGFLAQEPSAFPIVILDVDCLFIGSGEDLFETINHHGLLSYVVEEIDADPTYNSNGRTKTDLQDISEEIFGHPVPNIRYCGGEVLGTTLEVATAIVAASSSLWDACLARHERGLQKLNTEEHFFSCLYAELGLPVGTANGLVRRIWTQRKYRNASVDDLGLLVWHLPAEKKYGFRHLFDDVIDQSSTFWRSAPDDGFARYLGNFMGVPHATAAKKVRDGLSAVQDRLHR